MTKDHEHAVIKHFYKKDENWEWQLSSLKSEINFDKFSITEMFTA